MITLGIDIGSTTSKCVLMRDGQEIIAASLRVGGLGTEGPAEALAELWEKSGITADDVDRTIVTGFQHETVQQVLERHLFSGIYMHLRTVSGHIFRLSRYGNDSIH